jgi:hypothetical protein
MHGVAQVRRMARLRAGAAAAIGGSLDSPDGDRWLAWEAAVQEDGAAIPFQPHPPQSLDFPGPVA